MSSPEARVALIHRVIVPDTDSPKEYSVLITNERSLFIRQEKTRSKFVLSGEMRYGTALVTDVEPPVMADYDGTTLDSIAANPASISVPHSDVESTILRKDETKFRYRDFFIWLTMKMQKEIFQVYHFDMTYKLNSSQVQLRFYMVPLGAWFKPRRQTQTREAILREYADEGLQAYRQVLPAGTVKSEV
jgi:hypothetical protein